MEGKVAAFKICCTEWSGTLYSVYNDIRKQRSERLAIDTGETFLPSFTEITLSIVIVFFFFVLLWVFCFIFKRSWLQSRKGKPENKRKIVKQQRRNIRSVLFFLFVLVRLSRWYLTFIFDTNFIIDIITNSRLTSPQGWFLTWTKTLGWVMVYISHTTNFFNQKVQRIIL